MLLNTIQRQICKTQGDLFEMAARRGLDCDELRAQRELRVRRLRGRRNPVSHPTSPPVLIIELPAVAVAVIQAGGDAHRALTRALPGGGHHPRPQAAQVLSPGRDGPRPERRAERQIPGPPLRDGLARRPGRDGRPRARTRPLTAPVARLAPPTGTPARGPIPGTTARAGLTTVAAAAARGPGVAGTLVTPGALGAAPVLLALAVILLPLLLAVAAGSRAIARSSARSPVVGHASSTSHSRDLAQNFILLYIIV